jgi:hypothetical protein
MWSSQDLVETLPPGWEEIDLSWEELSILPTRWRGKLAELESDLLHLRYIDAKGYVESMYGDENLLGRWVNYAATGHGGNRLPPAVLRAT